MSKLKNIFDFSKAFLLTLIGGGVSLAVIIALLMVASGASNALKKNHENNVKMERMQYVKDSLLVEDLKRKLNEQDKK